MMLATMQKSPERLKINLARKVGSISGKNMERGRAFGGSARNVMNIGMPNDFRDL